jgi:hypothetical protein
LLILLKLRIKMIKKIVYKTDLEPNHLTLHALFATLIDNQHLDKLDLPYKIYYQDKQITFIYDEDVLPSIEAHDNLSFNHGDKKIRLKKIKEEPFIINELRTDNAIRLVGTISYAINKGKNQSGSKTKKTNLCPINLHGNFIEGTRQHTLNYLNEKMGINLFDEKFTRSHRFEQINYSHFNTVTSKTNEKEIQFHNVFQFDVISFIDDIEKVNKLNYCSIGRKRNYGFGNVFVLELDNKLD